MKPIVAVDCDGVVVDNAQVWDPYFAKQYCGNPHDYSQYQASDWDRYEKVCPTCWNECLTSTHLIMKVIPKIDALFYLDALCSHYHLVMVTTRPSAAHAATERWFKRSGLTSVFKRLMFSKDKLVTCRMIEAEVLLDDAVHNLTPLLSSEVTPIVWDYPYNRVPLLSGVHRVSDWKEAADAIKTIFND